MTGKTKKMGALCSLLLCLILLAGCGTAGVSSASSTAETSLPASAPVQSDAQALPSNLSWDGNAMHVLDLDADQVLFYPQNMRLQCWGVRFLGIFPEYNVDFFVFGEDTYDQRVPEETDTVLISLWVTIDQTPITIWEFQYNYKTQEIIQIELENYTDNNLGDEMQEAEFEKVCKTIYDLFTYCDAEATRAGLEQDHSIIDI